MRLRDCHVAKNAAYLAKGVENVVEVDQDLALCDLGNVVHGLAGVITNTRILVGEAGEYRRYNDFKVFRKHLNVT